MTSINFPNDPQVGDTFLNFVFDGEKWRNKGNPLIPVTFADLYQFSVSADDSTQKIILKDENIKFSGAGGITTSSDAEGNITITGAATDLTGYATETFVTSRGYITGLSWNQLTDKPNLTGTYTFNVAADDSTLRTIGSEETIKFVGAGTVTTSSDAEGTITITGTATSSLVNGANTVSLGSDGVLTIPPNGLIIASTGPYGQQHEMRLGDGLMIGQDGGLANYKNVSWSLSGQNSDSGTQIRLPGQTESDNGESLLIQHLYANSSIDIECSDYLWSFRSDGVLTLPGDIRSEGNINIDINLADSTLRRWQFGEDGGLTFPDGTNQTTAWTGTTDQALWINPSPEPGTLFRAAVTASSDGVTIDLTTGIPGFGSMSTWLFTNDGVLTFPNDTIQDTAWTGSVDANDLTGTTLNSTVVTSSLTSLGTLSGLTVGGTGGDLTMTGGAITGVGNITAAGILAVNASGGITTTQTSFDIVNSTATTVNLGGAATAVNIGAITGTLTLNNPTVVGTQTTATLFNTTATTVSAFGAATTLTIGATSGTLTLRNTTIVGTQTSLTLFNTVSSTVNTFGAATTLNIGYTGTTGSNTTNILTAAQQTGTTKTINIATGSAVGSTTAVNIGSTLGTSTVTINGSLVGTLTGNASTATKLATARAINGVDFDGSAAITITAAAGTLSGSILASGVTASSLTSVGTLTGVTSNAATAFTAGDAAISGVALQIPREGAIRNLYNGSNNMYFDVSTGGTTQGQFQFRSSSAFTNILTMSPTAFNVNTDAVVTARTPSFGRLPFNSAIDTELTIDDYRFRINTTTGNTYAQVISNVSGQTRNSAWTAVAAISGQAVGQGGSTGTLVPNNAWTSLYTFASMNSAGDTVTVTLQDKQNSRIYRVTFMRSDNGSTAGYNIIAERLL